MHAAKAKAGWNIWFEGYVVAMVVKNSEGYWVARFQQNHEWGRNEILLMHDFVQHHNTAGRNCTEVARIRVLNMLAMHGPELEHMNKDMW